MASAAKQFETLFHSGKATREDGCLDSEFLDTALELLESLRTEEKVLKRFSGAELLAILPKKEYLANELEWKLRSARESKTRSFAVSDAFKALLAEISRLNRANGVFIKMSLSYWRDLESILSPPGYGRTGRKGVPYLRPPRGLTFRQEV